MNVGKLLVIPAMSVGFLLCSSCAYNEVMNERQAENQYLRGQLQAEQERGARLRQ